MLECKKFMYLAGAKEEVVNFKSEIPIEGYFNVHDPKIQMMRNMLITRYGIMISRKEIYDLPNRLRYSLCTPRVFREVSDELRKAEDNSEIGVSEDYNSFIDERVFFNRLNKYISDNLGLIIQEDADLSKLSDIICGNLLMSDFETEVSYISYRRDFQTTQIKLPASIYLPTYKVLIERCSNWIARIYRNDHEFKKVLSVGLRDLDFEVSPNFIELSYKESALANLLGDRENISVYIDGENMDTIKTYLLTRILLGCKSISKITLVLDSPSMLNWDYACNGEVKVEICTRILKEKNVGDLLISYRIAEDKFKNGFENFLIVSADSDFFNIVCELGNDNVRLILSDRASKSYLSALTRNDVKYEFIDDLVEELEDYSKATGLGTTLEKISVLEKIAVQE